MQCYLQQGKIRYFRINTQDTENTDCKYSNTCNCFNHAYSEDDTNSKVFLNISELFTVLTNTSRYVAVVSEIFSVRGRLRISENI